jgi:hypothetical protein
MEVTWDRRKAAANLKKHKVSFEEASTVLADPLAITGADPDHSIDEVRWITFGPLESPAAPRRVPHRGGRHDPYHQRTGGDTPRTQAL